MAGKTNVELLEEKKSRWFGRLMWNCLVRAIFSRIAVAAPHEWIRLGRTYLVTTMSLADELVNEMVCCLWTTEGQAWNHFVFTLEEQENDPEAMHLDRDDSIYGLPDRCSQIVVQKSAT
jgi:hypothetical protein